MKKNIIICLAFILLSRFASAAVVDAPHNDTNNIGCTRCHSYSVWWQYSPVQSDSRPGHGRAEQVNSICLSCHGATGPEIGAVSHSSLGMTSLHRGTLADWSRVCTDCHDPHFQAQLDWQPTIPVTASGLYLVIGNLAASPLVTGLGTTTSPYSSTFQFSTPVSTKVNWDNATTSIGTEAIRLWSAKSGTVDRGLILVLADGLGHRTFEITGVTDNSITVNGNIPAASFPSGTRFGLIYGQLIRSKIVGPVIAPATKGVQHNVKFFDPNGGFVDTSASKDGLCQVCHTSTNHFQYNATNATTDHQDKTDAYGASGAASHCTQCHTHGRGFAPGADTGKHPEHIAMGVSCEVCHIPGGPAMSPLTATGCSTCHQDGHGGAPNDGGTYRDNWFNLSPSYALVCNSCHTLPPSYTSSPAKANSHKAHTVYTCNTCHFATTADGTTITSTAKHLNKVYDVTPDVAAGVTLSYTAPLTIGAGGTCSNISCHANTGATWGSAQSVTCQSCHLGTADVDDFTGTFYNNNQIAKIAGASEWSATGHGKAAGNYPSGNAAANFAGNNACLYCHDNTITHKTAANPFRLKNFTDPTWGKNGVCQSCHAAGSLGVTVEATLKNGAVKIGLNHLGAKHDATKNGGQFCWDCHDGHGDSNAFMIQAAVAKTSDLTTGAPIVTAATVFTSFATGSDYATSSEPYTGLCQVCHSSTSYYNPSANGHYTDKCTLCHPHAGGFTPGSDSGKHTEHLAMGLKCEVCHVLGSTELPNPSTSIACSTCHQNGYDGTPNDDAYRDHWNSEPYSFGCTSCHSKPPAYTNSPAKANSHAAHSANTCNKCHAVTTADGNTIASFAAHGNKVYDVNPADGLTLTYTYSASGSTCATISCHGDNSATWGGASLTCQSCHLAAVDAPDVDDFEDTFYDNDVASKIANTVGWSTTGHGRPLASESYPSGNTAADFTVANACLYCHDNTISHKTVANPFRLKYFSDETWGKNGVCQSCHAADSVGVTVDTTLRNSSIKIGSDHNGTKHDGAANNGGQFCWDCHDAHGDGNKFMIHDAVAKTSNVTTGAPTLTVATEFTESLTGADYTKATANGICQVCHTSTTYYSPTANGHHTEEGVASKCTICHAHSDGRGFGGGVSGKHSGHLAMGAACNDCHVAGSKGVPNPLTSTKCNTCHQDGKQGNPNDGGEYRKHWTDASYTLTCNSCHKGRLVIADMVNTPKYTHIPAADSHCDSCHDGAVVNTNYTHLPGDTNCVTCHDGPGANVLTNFKAVPVGMQSAGHTRLTSSKWIRQYRCYFCHTDTSNTGNASDTDTVTTLKTAHLNGTIDVKIDSQWDIVNKPAPQYIPATQTCLNVYCHSDGTTVNPEMRDYAWTGGHQECNSCHGHQPSAGGCNASGCHSDGRDGTYWAKFPEKKWLSAMPMYQNTGPNTDKANSHYRHLFTGFSCDDCHAGTISGGSCLNCHGTEIPSGNMTENKHINPGNHVNREKNVVFKNVGSSYDRATKTCNNTLCHTGSNPQWGGSVHDAIVCRDCHGSATADVDDFGKFNGSQAKINLNQWASTGHGRPGELGTDGKVKLDVNRYPSGNPPANFPGNGCWYCHDSQVLHQNEERPFRLIQHEHFKNRFEKECVFCHMQGVDSECLNCHNASESIGPQLATIVAKPGVIHAPYTIAQPAHSGYTGGGCSAATCHTGDQTRHKTDAGVWTVEKKDDVKNAYVQMGVCLKCHDDDRSGECTTCHQAPAENPQKYDTGFDPASIDPGLVGKTAGRIAPQKAKASSFHFGYKHYQAYENSLGSQLDIGSAKQLSFSTREVIDTSKTWTQDAFIGRRVTITSGANIGLSRPIVRNSATTLTVAPPFPDGQQLQVGDAYKIMDIVWKGGKFCWDCHDPHGDDNIYMVQNMVATRTDGVVGKPIERKDVSFTRKSTGLDYARIAPNPATGKYDGVCNACHTDSSMHYTSTKGDNHNSGRICTECHEHRFTDSHASGQSCNSCHADRPVPRHTAFGQARDCTKCHKDAIGARMNIMKQFSSNSHHVQADKVTNKHCYACHWESTPEGVINTDRHAGYNSKTHTSQKDAAVDLVIWQPGVRPTSFDNDGLNNNDTATSFLASKIDTTKPGNTLVMQRAEVDKVSKHCLGCHSDQNNTVEPFNMVDPAHGDCKTPIQYAWDRASIASRYSSTGTAILGKYTTTTNAAKKNITKAYSAHGNAVANQGGINATTGVDETIPNTRAGLYNIQCFDCHSSHGSMVSGITSSYPTFNGTKNGANLKETQAGKGGYPMSYMATANTNPSSVNPYQAGAGQCFDCHETASSNVVLSPVSKSPWGYTETFGATAPIKGYRDNPRFLGPYSGASQFSGYRASKTTNGGHFKASSALTTPAMGTIDGLCTPCHDPHGVSSSLGDKKAYAVPLLKGTWLSSPYKEDGPPSDNTSTFNNARNNWAGTRPYPNRANPQAVGIWRTDRNTFNMTDLSVKANQPVAYGQVTEDAETFAGLCLTCHPKGSLTSEASVTPTASVGWKSKDRVHRSVKGWGVTDGQTPREHAYTCSKCHQPHASGLPRLMQTNCLSGRHRGKQVSGGVPSGSTLGHFPYGWWDNDAFTANSTSICHGAPTANGSGSWPNNQRWNNLVTWPPYDTTYGGQ